jgi:hypothetical protein
LGQLEGSEISKVVELGICSDRPPDEKIAAIVQERLDGIEAPFYENRPPDELQLG